MAATDSPEVDTCASPILAFGDWKDNAEMMLACRDLGYLDDEHDVWDCTYGHGAFWRRWSPAKLLGTDINPFKSHTKESVDFTASGFARRQWHHIVFDPPYKLNGTPDPAVDERYGVEGKVKWQDRMELIRLGVVECARVLGDGYLLVKCQDQVVSAKVRWQTVFVHDVAEMCGLEQWDRLDMPSYRPQPEDRDANQQHARSNTSTLLVFKRGRGWRP